MPPIAACTIVSKNYLPFARTLAGSFQRQHPDGEFHVLLVDRVDGYFEPAAEPFELLEAERLPNLPDFPGYAFQYSLLEINTAVKPFYLDHLLAKRGLEALLYFDPDILILGSLDQLAERLTSHSILLTPHLTAPLEDDGRHPSEQSILKSGAYNLGFLGLRAGETTSRFLDWWQQRVHDRCVVDVARGLFVDQKWIDLVPSLFEDVEIVTDRGCNTAYWNLHDRRLMAGEDRLDDGCPLTFFHFSGVELDHLERVSKHQDRYTLLGRKDLRPLFERYRGLVLDSGWRAARRWPYAYGRFDNGVPVPPAARSLYRSLDSDRRRRFGDPFVTSGSASLIEWLNQPARGGFSKPYVSRLLQHLYRRDLRLQLAFPDLRSDDLPGFTQHLNLVAAELELDSVFLEPLAGGSDGAPAASPSLRARLGGALKRCYHSRASRRLQRFLEERLGFNPVVAARARLRGERPAPQPDRRTIERIAEIYEGEVWGRGPGVNVAGYIRAESGTGQGVRAFLEALETTDLPTARINLDLGVASRMEDDSHHGFDDSFEHGVNVFWVNADQAESLRRHLGAGAFEGRTNVAFWAWELSELPDEWLGAFELFDEIWTPSSFTLEAISKKASIPVRRLPHPVRIDLEQEIGRDRFDLPPQSFVFLFIFDFLSFFERKNPLAVIDAFRRFLRPEDDARLVIKMVNSDRDPEARQELERRAEGLPVQLVDEYFTRAEVYGLLAACDCYVSLHRCEGFGLTLAEAMYLGKPVIGTHYSGNVDFMRLGNSLPVSYRLIELERDYGPYKKGECWADADVGHAAELMRRVYDQPELRAKIASRAADTIRKELSPQAVGRLATRYLERAQRVHRDRALATLPGSGDRPDLAW